MLISALSVPQASDDLGRLVEENWVVLEKATSLEVLKAFRLIGQLKDLSKYTDEQIWAAIQKKNEGTGEEAEDPDDLKSPEWKVFSNPTKAKASRTFKLRTVDPPTDFTKYFEKIVLVEKLRRSGRSSASPASCRHETSTAPPNCLPNSGPNLPQRPDVDSRLRNTGRRHLLPVLRAADSGMGRSEITPTSGNSKLGIRRGGQPRTSTRTKDTPASGTSCCIHSPTP